MIRIVLHLRVHVQLIKRNTYSGPYTCKHSCISFTRTRRSTCFVAYFCQLYFSFVRYVLFRGKCDKVLQNFKQNLTDILHKILVKLKVLRLTLSLLPSKFRFRIFIYITHCVERS